MKTIYKLKKNNFLDKTTKKQQVSKLKPTNNQQIIPVDDIIPLMY